MTPSLWKNWGCFEMSRCWITEIFKDLFHHEGIYTFLLSFHGHCIVKIALCTSGQNEGSMKCTCGNSLVRSRSNFITANIIFLTEVLLRSLPPKWIDIILATSYIKLLASVALISKKRWAISFHYNVATIKWFCFSRLRLDPQGRSKCSL